MPQGWGSDERSSARRLGFLRGRTEIQERLVAELYAHGLSTRDLELAFTEATGGWGICRRLVSEVPERLWQEPQAFRQRRLGDLEVAYLFCDGW